MIVCNEAHRFLVRDELDEAGITPHAIILEPVARNTAPAIVVAALSLARTDRDAIMVVGPSDHVIGDEAAFAVTVARAADIARIGKLVLFGVPPICAHTGYGYIQRGDAIENAGGAAYTVSSFREKPDAETAKDYVSKGGYYWNSGIFVLHVASFLTELESLAPDVLAAVTPAVENARDDLGFLRLDEIAFSKSPAISIDYAVMEKTGEAAMLPLDAGWSDVGSWSALWDLAPRDEQGNAVNGQTSSVLEDTTGCYIHSERALISTLGVDNLIIVNTPDALLVADKDRAEEVSGLVAKLKESNRSEHASHIREYRPWGYFEALSEGPRFQVKLLHVKPGGKLSHQMHHHRSEHWVVVKGTAKVTIGDCEKLVGENESVYIFATQWHRLENPGTVPLEIIEVQTGSYFGEDDIIRSDDVYNRAATE